MKSLTSIILFFGLLLLGAVCPLLGGLLFLLFAGAGWIDIEV